MMVIQFTHIWDSSTKKKEILTFKNGVSDEVAIGIALLMNPSWQILKTERRSENETELPKFSS